MALINCPECNKEISDKAVSCPNCGVPIKEPEQVSDEYLACPKCMSKHLHTEKAGFSGKKAVAGAVLTGGIGILAGTLGSKSIYITCLKCNHRFKAGEAKFVKNNRANKALDQRVIDLYKKNSSRLEAVQLYKNETNVGLAEATTYVNALLLENIPNDPVSGSKSGCIVTLIALISLSVLITYLVT